MRYLHNRPLKVSPGEKTKITSYVSVSELNLCSVELRFYRDNNFE